MRVVVIGDIGPVDGMIHIGDEAMFGEAVTQLRRRGVEGITAISSNPSDSAARYAVDALLPVARGGSREHLATAVAASDGVLVAGGGNLSSLWPWHIQERAELARLAAELGRPLVVTGQTIGPELTPSDRATVSRLLGSARLVGSREPASAALVAALGVPAERAQQNVDDASFAIDGPGEGSVHDVPYALVTLARHVGGADPERARDSLARLVDEVAAHTGLEIVFHAHFASLNEDAVLGDSAIHASVGERLRSARWRVAPTTDVAASTRLARGAALVVTTRYHPAVFAGPAGVPTIGIPVDDYTGIKLEGALGAFGQDGILRLEQLLESGPAQTVRRVWEARTETRERGLLIAEQARPRSSAWWDRVHAELGA